MYAEIDGIKINYECRGEGAPVVLLHGWGANIKLFDALMTLISKKYKAIALDLPGFGLSSEPPVPWTVSDYTKLVTDFISSLGISDVILLGHSFGGRIIIKMMANGNLPFKVSKIILTGAAGIKPKKTFAQKAKLYAYKISKKVLLCAPVKKAFPDALEKLRQKNGSSDYSSATPVMRATLVNAVNEDLLPLISKICVPTLLIWGTNDTATPISDGEKMEELIADSGLVRVEGAGHYAFLEQPYFFGRVVSSFLNIGE